MGQQQRSYGMAVDLLDQITDEAIAQGKARRLMRSGTIRQMYVDVGRYMLYVESLTDAEPHQLLRLKRAKWFMPHAARCIVQLGVRTP